MEKVAWVHVRGGRLLVARNRGRQSFYLPGGRQEPGETDVETLAREIAEELSAVIVTSSMVHVATVTAERDGAPGSLQMRCYTAEHQGELVPSTEIAELAWVTDGDRDRVTHAERQVMDHLIATGCLISE